MMKPFKTFYTYEYLPNENILHIGYQSVKLESKNDVDQMWKEAKELISLHPNSWAIVCYDNLDFSFEGIETLFQRIARIQEQLRGVYRYTSGRIRMDKRFAILQESARQKIQTNLFSSEEEVFQAVRNKINETP